MIDKIKLCSLKYTLNLTLALNAYSISSSLLLLGVIKNSMKKQPITAPIREMAKNTKTGLASELMRVQVQVEANCAVERMMRNKATRRVAIR